MKTRYIINNKWAEENRFKSLERDNSKIPSFEDSKHLLPKPFIQGDQTPIECYWKTWQLAFKNLRPATEQNGFVANFIDTAFNNYLFMWDSVFILMFGKYGNRAFNFQRTLDNFYCKQEPDGYMSREMNNDTGEYRWEAFDPVSTGPNVLHWSEFEYWLNYADKKRLEMVFPPLLAYHEWTRLHRSWQDGTYWNTGFGCGMDNQPRIRENHIQFQNAHHGFMSWIDASFQAVFSAKNLLKMAELLGRKDEVKFLCDEIELLENSINQKMWNEKENFYFDRYRDGKLNTVKTIGAYWGLLAEAVPQNRIEAFISHLDDEKEFKRPHRIPSINASHPNYKNDGGYWLGGVWPPTNYMVLRGLSKINEHKLAFEIAQNHLQNVWEVFKKYNTVFENYAPEFPEPGKPAKDDFVGWGGVPPVAVFFEYYLGIQPDVPNNNIVWHINLTAEHGVENYPFGKEGTLYLKCESRKKSSDEPVITAKANKPVKLIVKWGDKQKVMNL